MIEHFTNMAETIPLGEKGIRSGVGAGGARFAMPYSGDYPDKMIAWFTEHCSEPVGYEVDKSGRQTPKVNYVPTYSGFAASINVSRPLLERWAKEHKGFKAAWDICWSMGVSACWQIIGSVPALAKGVMEIIKYEYGIGVGEAPKEFAPIRIFEVGQKVEAPVEEIEEIEAGEEAVAIEATETTDVKPMEVKTDEN